MSVTKQSSARHPGDDKIPSALDVRQIFFTNLKLLGFNTAAHEAALRIPFNKDMFTHPNKAGSEAVLHFLFEKLDPVLCREQFRDCWPIKSKKEEAQFRRVCIGWLTNIQKEEPDAKLYRVSASMLLSPGGEKFYELVCDLSTYVLLQVIRKSGGVHERDVLLFPALSRQSVPLGDVTGRAFQCGSVRHRQLFLARLHTAIGAEKQRSHHFSDLVKEDRRMTKSMRELEREIQELKQISAENAAARGSPYSRKSRNTSTVELDRDSIKRAQRFQKTQGMWRQVTEYSRATTRERQIVESILDESLLKYEIDSTQFNVTVPDLLLRECEAEIHRRHIDNVYQGGKLNLVSVVQLWNLALRMLVDRLHQGVPTFESDVPKITSQVHTHQALLANIKAFRQQMSTEILPDLKSSIAQLRQQWKEEVSQKKTPHAKMLDYSLATPSPVVSFKPADQSGTASVDLTALQQRPETVLTPEAAVQCMETVVQSVRKGSRSLFQDSPVYAPRIAGHSQVTTDSRMTSTQAASVTSSRRTASLKQRVKLSDPISKSRPGGAPHNKLRHRTAPAGHGVSEVTRSDVKLRSSTDALDNSSRDGHSVITTGSSEGGQHSRVAPVKASLGQKVKSQPQTLVRRQPTRGNQTPPTLASQTPLSHENVAALVSQTALSHHNVATVVSQTALSHHDVATVVSQTPISYHDVDTLVSQTALSHQDMATAVSQSPLSHHNVARAVSHQERMISSHPATPTRQSASFSSQRLAPSPRTLPKSHDILADKIVSAVMQEEAHLRAEVALLEESLHQAGLSPPDISSLLDVNLENPVAALSDEAFVSKDRIPRSPLEMEIRRMFREAVADHDRSKSSAQKRLSLSGEDKVDTVLVSEVSPRLNPENSVENLENTTIQQHPPKRLEPKLPKSPMQVNMESDLFSERDLLMDSLLTENAESGSPHQVANVSQLDYVLDLEEFPDYEDCGLDDKDSFPVVDTSVETGVGLLNSSSQGSDDLTAILDLSARVDDLLQSADSVLGERSPTRLNNVSQCVGVSSSPGRAADSTTPTHTDTSFHSPLLDELFAQNSSHFITNQKIKALQSISSDPFTMKTSSTDNLRNVTFPEETSSSTLIFPSSFIPTSSAVVSSPATRCSWTREETDHREDAFNSSWLNGDVETSERLLSLDDSFVPLKDGVLLDGRSPARQLQSRSVDSDRPDDKSRLMLIKKKVAQVMKGEHESQEMQRVHTDIDLQLSNFGDSNKEDYSSRLMRLKRKTGWAMQGVHTDNVARDTDLHLSSCSSDDRFIEALSEKYLSTDRDQQGVLTVTNGSQ